MKQFKEKNASDHEFEQLFTNYYGMNVGGGLTRPQKKKFFDLLFSKEKETDLEKILINLHGADENKPTWFLSFATKLRHTVNTRLPIYDSRVASTLVLGLPVQENYGPTTDLRLKDLQLKNRIEINKTLEECSWAMLADSQIKKFLKRIRGNLTEKIGLLDKLSEEKLLDSCLWALYKCRKK